MNRLHAQQIRSTGDPAIDLLACVWSAAFRDAESGDRESRQAIIEQFGFSRVEALHKQQLITWDPAAVHMQLTLEV